MDKTKDSMTENEEDCKSDAGELGEYVGVMLNMTGQQQDSGLTSRISMQNV